MLLCVPHRFVTDFLAIFSTFFVRSHWNLQQLFQSFRRTLCPNFIKIGRQIKIFPIDLNSKKSAWRYIETYRRRHRIFYYWGQWGNFLFFVRFLWNLDTEFVSFIEIIAASFNGIGQKMLKISPKIQWQNDVGHTIVYFDMPCALSFRWPKLRIYKIDSRA